MMRKYMLMFLIFISCNINNYEFNAFSMVNISQQSEINIKNDIKLLQKLEALPKIELMNISTIEDVFNNLEEVFKQLNNSGLGNEVSFKHVISFNKKSLITGEGHYIILVVSLKSKKGIKLDANELWKINKGLASLTDLQRQFLTEITIR